MAAIKKAVSEQSWHARFGNYAQVASAIISCFGFYFVVSQIEESRQKGLEESARAELADARKLYLAYSDAALRYAYLTEPDYDALMRDHQEYLRYKQFVSQMLYSYDEILNAVGNYKKSGEDQAEWVASFEIDVEAHQRYLCQAADPRFLSTYRPGMRRRLEQANKANCKDMPPLEEQHAGSAGKPG
jgi:hypothetical protein